MSLRVHPYVRPLGAKALHKLGHSLLLPRIAILARVRKAGQKIEKIESNAQTSEKALPTADPETRDRET